MGKVRRKKDTTLPADEELSTEESAQHGLTLRDVIQAIKATIEALETKIDTLGMDLSLLRDDHHRLVERVATTEREVVEIPPAVADLTT
ncbi:hypothetical protein NDU88_004772 [Pleurodeles waltl]|uniref:Uncharacterized protein n=1 Tax=Pleurodeles waltl TaxID=8319 RepID=A0AAV7UGH4_PLEWA|nr:hypothetical protein NDU88_004772 [Pleurodeles waltl]